MKIRGIELILQNLLKSSSVKNGIWMYLLQIFNTIVPLLTLPYLTRILGASGYGIITIALNIIGYYQVFVEYGFGMSASRKITLARESKSEIDKTYTCVLYSRVLITGMCVIISLIYGLLNSEREMQCICLMILLICLPGYTVQQDWLFQGMQNMKYISLVNILARGISTLLIFVFVKSENDIFVYCILFSAAPIICGFVGLLLARKKYDLKIARVAIGDVVEELKSGFYVFTTQMSSKVLGAIGITFLGIFRASTEVGIYSAIQKIANIILIAWLPISQVMYPITSQHMRKSFAEGTEFIHKMRKLFLPIFASVAIMVGLFSKQIVGIAFGMEYVEYYYWTLPLLLWMVVSVNNTLLGIQTLLGSGHDKEYSKCFQVGVVCTVLFNLILIFFFGGNGACMAPLLSELVLGVLLKCEVNKLVKQ